MIGKVVTNSIKLYNSLGTQNTKIFAKFVSKTLELPTFLRKLDLMWSGVSWQRSVSRRNRSQIFQANFSFPMNGCTRGKV